MTSTGAIGNTDVNPNESPGLLLVRKIGAVPQGHINKQFGLFRHHQVFVFQFP
jgi:hypothetical protein